MKIVSGNLVSGLHAEVIQHIGHFTDKVHVTNFIQLVSPQLVDRFSQTKLHCKAPNEGYSHMCGMHKSDNK